MRVEINQLLHRARVVRLASTDEAFQGRSAFLVARIQYAGLARLKDSIFNADRFVMLFRKLN